MVCPYCGKEMRKGFVHGQSGIYWSEKRHWVLNPMFGFDKTLIDLNPEAPEVEAWLCEDCGKVIIDYKEK